MISTKARLLSYLKTSQGEWVSGEWVSQKMGVSRSALWKHVGTLRKEGYEIESSPKKGYLFQRVADLLLPGEIQEGLKTRRFGKERLFVLRETDSTNSRAKELAAEGAPEGTAVVAEEQTQGRGRRGRTWVSPAGEGIYCSLVLRPRIPPSEATGITLMAAVAVADLLHDQTSLSIQVKWPNDLLVGGKKIAGILTEVGSEMDMIDYMVVGLGLNVNMPPRSFPADLGRRATSLFMETGKTDSRVRLIQGYLKEFEGLYETFRTKGLAPILMRWKEFAEIIGRQIQVDMLGQKVTGRVLDVDMSGALIIRNPQGKRQRIFSGDITLLPPQRPAGRRKQGHES